MAVPSRFRRQINAPSFALAEDGRTVVATITAGEGAPTADAEDGSLYLRTDAASAATALYARIGGAWVAIDGTSA